MPNDLIVNRLSHTTKSHDIFFDPRTMTGMPTSSQLAAEMIYDVSSSSESESSSESSDSEFDEEDAVEERDSDGNGAESGRVEGDLTMNMNIPFSV